MAAARKGVKGQRDESRDQRAEKLRRFAKRRDRLRSIRDRETIV
jgi:hypothetical protein